VRVPQRHVVCRRRLRRTEERGRFVVLLRARGQCAAAARRDRAVGLRAPASRELFRRRPRAMGAAPAQYRMAIDLRLFHARADGAHVRGDADESLGRVTIRELRTVRLTLEPQVEAHADAMFELLMDPAIYEYENAPPESLEWLRERFRKLES